MKDLEKFGAEEYISLWVWGIEMLIRQAVPHVKQVSPSKYGRVPSHLFLFVQKENAFMCISPLTLF